MSSLSARISSLSPEKLALLERRLRDRGGTAPRPERIPRRQEGDPSPLSFAQERLWFLDQFNPGNPAYNLPAVIPLPQPLDADGLRRALDQVVRRHEALRTTFDALDGEPRQVVHPDGGVKLEVVETDDPDALAAREARRRFDLSRGPLLSAVLAQHEGRQTLLLTLHHIVADGWSLGLVFRELSAFYESWRSGRPAELPELPVQYADFALWQRRWLDGERLAGLLESWTGRLRGAPPVLELPTDRPRPAVQTFRGAFLSFALPPGLPAALAALGRREGVVPFTTLLAGFLALLHRYTGQEDLVVGTPIANRNRTEIEGVVGFFVNMLVLRTDLSGNPGFRELLRRVREVTLAAYAGQDLPFEKLVEALQPERSLGHTPLFQVTFAFQNAPTWQQGAAGDRGPRGPKVVPATAKFDLTLGFTETGDGLEGAVELRTDLFDATTVLRMVEHLGALLRSAVDDPDRALGDLEMLAEAERHQAVLGWNDTRDDLDDVCLHELFEAEVERSRDREALAFEGRRLTYGELDEQAERLAAELAAAGVGPDRLVGVCLERSLELMVALLGVLKAGGAYVPLDPGLPPERLAGMLEETRPAVVLKRVDLREGSPRPAPPRRRRRCGPDDLAYVLYTSGSTGRPKGSMITHRAICNRLLWMQRQYRIGPGDRVLQKTPISFDVSVWELFWPLLTGACLVMARPEGHRDGSYLVRAVRDESITTMHFVPSMLRAFLEEEGVEGCVSLRRVMASGEALPADLVARFFERCPGGTGLHNLYGPTEAAVDVTVWECSRGTVPHNVPIGRPISNIRILILDPWLNAVPAGVPGELLIGGVGLARGYLGRPDLTAERFVPDPLSGTAGERLYRTGDLARFRPDGTIEYLGRLDHQIKLRGHRIEPAEIELALVRHPGVREAAVLLREVGPGDRRLVAYLTGEPGLDGEELRRFLAGKLPEAMVPSAFVRLDAFPLTSSGKLDRRALPEVGTLRRELAREAVAPRDPMEEAVAAIWTEVLKVDRVGVFDSFFDLGGHSLLATQVLSRIRSSLQAEVSLGRFFEDPTVAGLAAAVAREGQARKAPEPEIRSRAGGGDWDLDRLPDDVVDALLRVLLQGETAVDDLAHLSDEEVDARLRGLLAARLLPAAEEPHPPMSERLLRAAAEYQEALRRVWEGFHVGAVAWEEARRRSAEEYRIYLGAVHRAWQGMNGDLPDPAALAAISHSLAAAASLAVWSLPGDEA